MGIRPFSWGHFGVTPEVPEYECSGDFYEDLCKNCSEYEKCRKLEEDFTEDYVERGNDDV